MLDLLGAFSIPKWDRLPVALLRPFEISLSETTFDNCMNNIETKCVHVLIPFVYLSDWCLFANRLKILLSIKRNTWLKRLTFVLDMDLGLLHPKYRENLHVFFIYFGQMWWDLYNKWIAEVNASAVFVLLVHEAKASSATLFIIFSITT